MSNKRISMSKIHEILRLRFEVGLYFRQTSQCADVSTGAIESLNSVIRHAIKKRKVFPTDDSVKKVVWLAIQSASQKWTIPLKDWRMAMSRFIIEFDDRLDGHF